MLLFENDFAPLVEQLKPACREIERFVTLNDKVPVADLTYEELLDQGHAERADIFYVRRKLHRRIVLYQRQHRNAQGRHAGPPHAVSARARGRDIYKEPETMVDLHTIPLFHANGWGRPQASTMLGTKQVMVRRFEPAGVFKLIAGASRHRHGAGADHGERAAELAGHRELRSFEHAHRSCWAAPRRRRS